MLTSFAEFEKFFVVISSCTFSAPPFSFTSGTLVTWILDLLSWSCRYLSFCCVFFFFPIFCMIQNGSLLLCYLPFNEFFPLASPFWYWTHSLSSLFPLLNFPIWKFLLESFFVTIPACLPLVNYHFHLFMHASNCSLKYFYDAF